MTLPQNVADALGELEAAHDQRFAPWRNQWQTIRAHLMSQEAEIERVKSIADAHCDGRLTAIARLAAANAQLRLMHRVLSQAVCVGCADDGSAKDHELDKLEGVLRCQGWITTAVVPSTPTDAHLQGAGDE